MKLRTKILLAATIAICCWQAVGAESANGSQLKVCLLSACAEYKSHESMAILQTALEKRGVECKRAFGEDKGNRLPGLEALPSCDLMVVFTRRIVLPDDQLELVKKHLAAGKPVVGIRTASHAFQNYLQLDKEVFGGSYNNHYNNDDPAPISIVPGMAKHPILDGLKPFITRKLYKNPALAEDVTVLLTAATPEYSEPVAWTHRYRGGRMFYTSLGVPEDFERPEFVGMLVNAVLWTSGKNQEQSK